MNTYFIRHTQTMDIDDQTRKDLWSERRVAIHFPHDRRGRVAAQDNTSTDPHDYIGSAKTALTTLTEIATEGGYVCAQHYPHTDWMLGLVTPGSKIEVRRGKWGSLYGNAGRTAILKTLRLSKVRLINPLSHATLHVGRPRQGTIRRWPSASNTVKDLVEHAASKPSLNSLTHSQQEILCSEFLRLPQAEKLGLPRLAHLRLPIGRTMPDVDVIGIATDGRPLLAQVTFSALSEAAAKLDRLTSYNQANRAHLLFFCKCPQQATIKGVTVFPLQQAYDTFISSPLGKAWLQAE